MWIRSLWFWLKELRLFWLALLVVALALGFSLRPGATEPEIRLVGLVLQVLGIGTVAWGIHRTRVLFGHPTFVDQLCSWLKRFPAGGKRVVSVTGNVTLPPLSVQGRGQTVASAGPNPTLDARIEALEKSVRLMNTRINQTQCQMDEGFRRRDELLNEEKQTRVKEDQALCEKLEATETGGLHISAMGALWLFVGVTLSTAAPEIAKYLS